MGQGVADHGFYAARRHDRAWAGRRLSRRGHRDPFDRMLAAQALVEDLQLVSADPLFRDFQVRVIW